MRKYREIHFSRLTELEEALAVIPLTHPMRMRFFQASLTFEDKISRKERSPVGRVFMYSEQECFDMLNFLKWPINRGPVINKFRACRERFIQANGGITVVGPFAGLADFEEFSGRHQ